MKKPFTYVLHGVGAESDFGRGDKEMGKTPMGMIRYQPFAVNITLNNACVSSLLTRVQKSIPMMLVTKRGEKRNPLSGCRYLFLCILIYVRTYSQISAVENKMIRPSFSTLVSHVAVPTPTKGHVRMFLIISIQSRVLE